MRKRSSWRAGRWARPNIETARDNVENLSRSLAPRVGASEKRRLPVGQRFVTTPDQPEAASTSTAKPEPTTLERKGWQRAIAPGLIGLFLWIAFYDQFPREVVGRGNLAWPVGGAVLGGLLGCALLYMSPALWSWRTGQSLTVTSTRTFGVRGARCVPGILIIAVQVVWIAVSVRYATVLTLRGLELVSLLDPAARVAIALGKEARLPSGLTIVTALSWSLAATMAGRYLVRVIGALMKVYPIVPAFILGVSYLVAMKGFPAYKALTAAIPPEPGDVLTGVFVLLTATQMVFAFISAAELGGADLGAGAKSERDVRTGGWVGIAGSVAVILTLAVLVVAGASAKLGVAFPVNSITGRSFTVSRAVEVLIGGRTAGVMLLGFGLAGLAPACFASYLLGIRANMLVPRISRTRFTLAAAVLAWLLVIVGVVDRLYPVLGILGAFLAPVAGAIAADFSRSKGAWPAARLGVNWPGIVSWAVGMVVGLIPVIGEIAGNIRLSRIQPASLFAFAVAYLGYLMLARSVGESPNAPTLEPLPPQGAPPPASPVRIEM
jgi:cytosine permease